MGGGDAAAPAAWCLKHSGGFFLFFVLLKSSTTEMLRWLHCSKALHAWWRCGHLHGFYIRSTWWFHPLIKQPRSTGRRGSAEARTFLAKRSDGSDDADTFCLNNAWGKKKKKKDGNNNLGMFLKPGMNAPEQNRSVCSVRVTATWHQAPVDFRFLIFSWNSEAATKNKECAAAEV